MSIELAQVNRLMSKAVGTPWPETFEPGWLARLQTWTADATRQTQRTTESPWIDALRVDCDSGGLPHTTTVEHRMVTPPRDFHPNEFGFQSNARFPTIAGRMYAYTEPAKFKDITHRHIAAADFARWLAAQGEQPSRLIAAWFKSQGVGAATEPQPAPASEPQSNTVIMKRKALIDELRHQWPTIEADLSEASRNGLSAASVGKGLWDRDKAEAWAKSRGKLKTSNVHALPGPWPGGVTRHQLKG